MMSLEAKLNEAIELNHSYQRVIVVLREALHQERQFNAQVELEAKIAALPTDAKERLRKAFPDIDLAGLRSAIKVEERGVR